MAEGLGSLPSPKADLSRGAVHHGLTQCQEREQACPPHSAAPAALAFTWAVQSMGWGAGRHRGMSQALSLSRMWLFPMLLTTD